MSIRDELIEAIKSEIQYLYLEGKSGPQEYSDSALVTLKQFLTAQGLQIVPVEPTEEMCMSGVGYCLNYEANPENPKSCYKAMLEAAPNPLAEDDGEDG